MPLVRDRHAWLEELSRGAGRVAHIGCADSPYTADLLAAGILLHPRLVSVADVTGIAAEFPAVEILQQCVEHGLLLSDGLSRKVLLPLDKILPEIPQMTPAFAKLRIRVCTITLFQLQERGFQRERN